MESGDSHQVACAGAGISIPLFRTYQVPRADRQRSDHRSHFGIWQLALNSLDEALPIAIDTAERT